MHRTSRRRSVLRAGGTSIALAALLAALPGVAGAEVPVSAPREPGMDWSSATLFAAGTASAFLMHEGCHAAANLAFGNRPHLEAVNFAGVLPFFAVAPGITCASGTCYDRDGRRFGGGRQGVFTIVMAGIQCQHLADEIILTSDPALRAHDAPFRKGLLAFNTLTSIAYVAANWASLEPPAGDLRGTYRDTGAPRNLVNALVLGAAVVDLSRYFFPDVTWLPWLSRAAKLGVIGITFTL